MGSNLIATCALLAWPLVAFCLYMTKPINQATAWTILGAHMLLPVGTMIKFEMVPLLDKGSISSFCALAGCLLGYRVAANRSDFAVRYRFGLTEMLMAIYVLSPFVSAMLNGDAIYFGDLVLPPTGIYDGISSVEAAVIALIPFYLGRKFLRSSSDSFEIMRLLIVAGLIYSLPMLFEIRFSPQLHYWIYGYFPTEFQQQIRGDTYRPMVFMGHGLLATLFLVTTLVAAAAMYKVKVAVWRLPPSGITLYLTTVLVLCKSGAATMYGVVLIALVWITKPQVQVRVGVILVSLSLSYPLLRSLDLVPTRVIVEAATSISKDRGASIAYRFVNEDILLARASERWLFGWGRFGRGRVYDETTGKDVSVADGRWIQTLGQFGFLGFFSEFGLLSLGVFRALSALRRCDSRRDKILFAALSLIVAISVFDLLPNPTLRPWTWFLAGVLLGRGEDIAKRRNGLKPSYSTLGAQKSLDQRRIA